MTSAKLRLYFSGGRINYSPDLSIGGTRSIVEVGEGKNNLFDDVPLVDAQEGSVDYRCIFVMNATDQIAQNCRIKVSKTTPAEDEIFLHAQRDLPIEIDALEFDSNIQLGRGILQSFQFTKKGISILEVRKGPNLGNPVDSIKFSITDDQFNSLFEREVAGSDWNSFSEDEIISIPIDVEILRQTNLQIVIERTGSIDFENDYQLKYSKIYHYFQGFLKIKQNGTWMTQVGNLAFRIRGYTLIGSEIESWTKEENFGTLQSGESIPIWIKREVPIGCNPLETNQFNLQLKGEF